ncbi:hypothetical protein EV424DRAFT_1536569 [Suillus variegatus]|nr:hypothetical protein EV424DRAFT_1536569 [Suillus variegatus]
MSSRQPRILICGNLVWAHEEARQFFDGLADLVVMDSPNRADFLVGLKSGGKYDQIAGIYRHNTSADRIGVFDQEIIDALAETGTVKWIAHNGAGYDQIDVLRCANKGDFHILHPLGLPSMRFHGLTSNLGISVSNTPGAVDDATATTALYLVISCLRNYAWAEQSLRQGTFKSGLDPGRAHDVTGRTLGILGLGGIGLRLAHLVHAFPMRVVYYSRNKSANAPEWCEYIDSLEGLFHLVGEKEIRTMKKGSIIVNTARGKVVDEEAMIRALEDGHLSSVGLDVYPNEPLVNPRLLEFPQNVLLPHMGTENQDSQRHMEVRALTNLRDFLRDGQGNDLIPELRSKL